MSPDPLSVKEDTEIDEIIDIMIEDALFGFVMKEKDAVKQGFASFFIAVPGFKVMPRLWVANERSFALLSFF